MRRQRSSVIIVGGVMLLLSVMLILLPADPVADTVSRLFFGADNLLSGPKDSANMAESNRIAELENENNRLKQELNFIESTDAEYVSAKIVAKSVQNYRSILDISAGKDDGVEVGQPVISGGQLVGRINEVHQNRSRIITIEDPDFRAAGLLEGTNVEGIVRSVPGGVVIEQVADQQKADRRDSRVITSGLGGLFPPGLLIGHVADTISDENDIFKQFSLKNIAHIGGLEEVTILL